MYRFLLISVATIISLENNPVLHCYLSMGGAGGIEWVLGVEEGRAVGKLIESDLSPYELWELLH